MRSDLAPMLGRTTTVVIFSVLPPFMVGTLSGQMRTSFDFSPSAVGFAVGTCFLSAALAAVPMGWLAQRIGPERSLRSATLLASGALAWVALVVDDSRTLAVGMTCAGFAGALAQPSANLLLRDRFADRFGLAMGVKQAAPPSATFLAGLAVPAISLTVGWRWAFALGSVAAAGAALLVPKNVVGRLSPPSGSKGARSEMLDASVLPALALLALGAAFATMSSMALVSHAVDGGTAVGLSPSSAGILVAVGSLFGVIARVASGSRADRRQPPHLSVVIRMIAVGSVALVLLSFDNRTVYLIACPVAFATIWGWNAVFYFAIGVRSAAGLGVVTGIVQSGVFAGGVFGPALFGVAADQWTYRHAWLLTAALGATGGLLVRSGGRWLRTELRRVGARAESVGGG